MQVIDLVIVLGVLGTVLGTAIYTRRYTRSVADFLSANRCAGRYLLTIASGVAGIGAISIVGSWETFYQSGFGAIHWGRMTIPLGLLLALSGWVIYRYRQTRAMTMAQFLERRYSRRFRIFAGTLCYVSGVLNYGIFPAVTGRFLMYFLDLPIYEWTVPGLGLMLNLTLGVVMAVMLTVALAITLNGGQIAVMVSDFLQGQLTNVCFLMLLFVLVYLVPWPVLMDTLAQAPEGESKLNPFDQGKLPDFSPWFFVMLVILTIYNYQVWQGEQAYKASARSPHEAKMANVLAQFRSFVTFLLVPLAALSAYVLLNNAEVQPAATAAATQQLDALQAAGDEQLTKQLTTTVALRELLPVGMLGLLASVMLMAAVSTDSTYLHSWGSIFVQDVASPIREAWGLEPLSPERHLKWLKRSVLAVAIFAWCFSMVFPVQQYVVMYLQTTGAIFTGGAGAVLIGGLYWRRGTTAGAWTAMVAGSTLAVTSLLILNIFWPYTLPWLKEQLPSVAWLQRLPADFWLNGVQSAVAVSVTASLTYVLVSLLNPRGKIDFDRLYYRGQYAVEAKKGEPDYVPKVERSAVPRWLRSLGITEEFTAGDKFIFGLKWLFFFWEFVIGFVGITIAYVAFGQLQTDRAWSIWWSIFLWTTATIALITTIWFLVGGFRDLFSTFRLLREIERDATDDGRVKESLGEASSSP